MTATVTSSYTIADSRDYTVELPDGRKLGYAIYGDRSSFSQTIIYMHGVPASRREGAFWHPAALQAGVRLLCPDRPGIGLSSTRLGGWTLLDFADDCTNLLHSLKVEEVSILGYSGGGPSAMALAYRLSCPSAGEEATLCVKLRSIGLVAAMGPYHLAIKHLGLMQRVNFALASWAPSLLGLINDFAIGNSARAAKSGSASARSAFQARIDQGFRFFDARSRVLFMEDEKAREMFASVTMQAFSGPGGTEAAMWDMQLLTKDWGFDLAEIAKSGDAGGKVPIKLWYGAEDRNVWPSEGEGFASLLKDTGADVQFATFENQTHFTIISERGAEILAELAAKTSEQPLPTLLGIYR